MVKNEASPDAEASAGNSSEDDKEAEDRVESV